MGVVIGFKVDVERKMGEVGKVDSGVSVRSAVGGVVVIRLREQP